MLPWNFVILGGLPGLRGKLAPSLGRGGMGSERESNYSKL